MLRIILLLLLAVGAGGCNLLAHPVYVLFGQTEKTVPAEYTNLSGEKIAIVTVGTPGIDFEYPFVRSDLALATAQEIGRNVKDVQFVPQSEVEEYQLAHYDWYSIPIGRVGKELGADKVLYIDLIEFTLLEPDSINLLRGRAWANVRIYDVGGKTPDDAVYETEIDVLFPETAPVAMSESARMAVRQGTIGMFGLELGRKFYKHKVKAR